MTSEISITFLGTGTSVGVPQIGCTCPVCLSNDPRNKRLRSSILISSGETQVLVDSSPDLRQQALREGFDRLDAVVYTHAHLDHISGFDDLRAFCWSRPARLPLYAAEQTMAVLKTMYAWAFSPENDYPGYVRPDARIITGEFTIGSLGFTPVPVEHAGCEAMGYLIEAGGARVGYACDAKSVPETSMELWQDLDLLVLDALRYREHPTHMNVNEALEVISVLRPRRALLTHMSHEIDFKTLAAQLPDHISAARDGLTVTLQGSCVR